MSENVIVLGQTGVGMSFERKKLDLEGHLVTGRNSLNDEARKRRVSGNVKVQGNYEHTPIFGNVELPSGMVVMHKDSHEKLHKQNLKDVLGGTDGGLRPLGTPSVNLGRQLGYTGNNED